VPLRQLKRIPHPVVIVGLLIEKNKVLIMFYLILPLSLNQHPKLITMSNLHQQIKQQEPSSKNNQINVIHLVVPR